MTEIQISSAPFYNTRGALVGRFFAYMIDIFMIALFSFLLHLIIFIFGFITLGFGWLFFPIIAGSAIIYSAITVGGHAQATIGMRWLGLKVIGPRGARVDWLIAAVHAIFFYIAAGTLVLMLLDIVTGFFRNDRRMLHDLLTGLTVVRA